MSNPIVHVEVVGEDAEALQGFYRNAFDWQMQPSGPDYAMAHPGVEGGIDGGVEGLGGSRVVEPMDLPDGPRIAMFADPEGHLVGLIETGSRRS
jgi:predicted enzyme related to lactoylglutathione lyase